MDMLLPLSPATTDGTDHEATTLSVLKSTVSLSILREASARI